MKTFRVLLAAMWAAAVALMAAPATADVVVLNLWATDGTQQALDRIEIPIDDRGFFAGEGTSVTNLWEIQWGLDGDADPVVNSNFTVLNTMGVPQDFSVTVTVPTLPPIPGPTVTSGSLGVVLTDGDLTGGLLTSRASNSAPIYTALIDGAFYDSLLDHPYSLPVGPGDTTSDSASFGLPGVTQPGPPSLTDIGLRIQFTLSAHDIAGITSTFTVLPVPEPSSIALGIAGLLACAAAARRR